MSVLKITKANFEKEVLRSEVPVLIDFWATWCGPCQMMSPVIEEVAAARPDIKVGKINVDEEGELAMQFGISSIPTLIVVKDGKVVRQSVGFKPKEQVLALV